MIKVSVDGLYSTKILEESIDGNQYFKVVIDDNKKIELYFQEPNSFIYSLVGMIEAVSKESDSQGKDAAIRIFKRKDGFFACYGKILNDRGQPKVLKIEDGRLSDKEMKKILDGIK